MPGRKARPIAERFWPKVEMGPTCWVWRGAKNNRGYGRIGGDQRHRSLPPVLAHRVSWEIHFGEIPANLLVCHHCDNPSCVNPAHLFLSTHKGNTHDSLRKGRMALKLNEGDVMEIRRRCEAGERAVDVALLFGVHRSTVHKIMSGNAWPHLSEDDSQP